MLFTGMEVGRRPRRASCRYDGHVDPQIEGSCTTRPSMRNDRDVSHDLRSTYAYASGTE